MIVGNNNKKIFILQPNKQEERLIFVKKPNVRGFILLKIPFKGPHKRLLVLLLVSFPSA